MGGGGGGAPQPSSKGSDAFAPMLKRHKEADAEFDITAMIDLVFMMNIYFLVTFLTAASSQGELPVAQHATALDGDTAVMMTLTPTNDGKGTVELFLATEEGGETISDPEAQEEAVKEFVDKGVAFGKTNVLIKADRLLKLGELKRIAVAASKEEVKLHLAVREKDE